MLWANTQASATRVRRCQCIERRCDCNQRGTRFGTCDVQTCTPLQYGTANQRFWRSHHDCNQRKCLLAAQGLAVLAGQRPCIGAGLAGRHNQGQGKDPAELSWRHADQACVLVLGAIFSPPCTLCEFVLASAANNGWTCCIALLISLSLCLSFVLAGTRRARPGKGIRALSEPRADPAVPGWLRATSPSWKGCRDEEDVALVDFPEPECGFQLQEGPRHAVPRGAVFTGRWARATHCPRCQHRCLQVFSRERVLTWVLRDRCWQFRRTGKGSLS